MYVCTDTHTKRGVYIQFHMLGYSLFDSYCLWVVPGSGISPVSYTHLTLPTIVGV